MQIEFTAELAETVMHRIAETLHDKIKSYSVGYFVANAPKFIILGMIGDADVRPLKIEGNTYRDAIEGVLRNLSLGHRSPESFLTPGELYDAILETAEGFKKALFSRHIERPHDDEKPDFWRTEMAPDDVHGIRSVKELCAALESLLIELGCAGEVNETPHGGGVVVSASSEGKATAIYIPVFRKDLTAAYHATGSHLMEFTNTKA